jgi:hypothetical protein
MLFINKFYAKCIVANSFKSGKKSVESSNAPAKNPSIIITTGFSLYLTNR